MLKTGMNMFRNTLKEDLYTFGSHFEKYSSVASIPLKVNKVKKPFFTILIPTYKRTEIIEETIQSALFQQTFGKEYEIVIVDNNPETKFDAERSIYQDGRISYFVNQKNIGLCGNWNRGIELSKGKYIVMLHDDDILGPYCLKNLYLAIRDNHYPGMVGCGIVNFSEVKELSFTVPEKLSYRRITKRGFFFGRYIGICGMTFQKKLARKIGGFNESYYPNEDTNFIYQMLLVSSIIKIENSLAGYRKGVNLSLQGNTMREIIRKMELTRKNIAEHEIFARLWMHFFDKEYLYSYIISANRTWNMQMDYQEVFAECGFENSRISKIKYNIMCILLKIENRMSIKYEIQRRIS